ncbi:Cthe_2314 family HEPN domain-containing protein [Cohnella luojiensis]|nr:Cthe_2314 family HEPN domain-containing protein [Cohnella luojiensis]
MLFGEKPREWTGLLLDTVQSMEQFALLASELAERLPEQSSRYHTFAIWAEGLLRSMDELEQSCYAAKRYSELVRHNHVDELSFEERLSYNRHVYYDKNSYIRIFAILDKLGFLLNQLLELRTERLKAHFSYFTVLRNLRENNLHVELMKPLNELKERYQGEMNRLRTRRNLEIHQMNAELKDDLDQRFANAGGPRTLEDLISNMADLDQSWEMVQGSINLIFRFACKRLREMG